MQAHNTPGHVFVVVTALVASLAASAGAAHPGAHGPGPSGPPGQGVRPHHDGGPACDADVRASFAALDDALRHLESELANTRMKQGARAHLADDLGAVLERAHAARVTACRESRDEVVVVEPPAPAVRVLAPQDEERLVGAMRRAAFEDERVAVLALGVRDVCVTAEQAKDLVRELTFSRGRVDAVRVLASRIVDVGRAYLVLDAMAFESDRREAREILSATPTAPMCRLPPRA